MAKRRGGRNTMYVRVLKDEFAALRRKSPQKAGQALRALAEEGRNIAVESMRESPASGRTYKRGSVSHVASSPGNPPRPDIGTLMNSIYVQRLKALVQRIAVGAEHGVYQEFGVEENGLEARPFMGPMARELEGLIPEFFEGFLEDEV